MHGASVGEEDIGTHVRVPHLVKEVLAMLSTAALAKRERAHDSHKHKAYGEVLRSMHAI
jgi:hypothetical protein